MRNLNVKPLKINSFNIIKYNIYAIALFLFIFHSCSSFSSKEEGLNQINLTEAKESDIVLLDSPDSNVEKTRRQIILPEFEEYCHVAADSNLFRWIGASNRMFPWVGSKDLTSIFEPKSPIPPRIPMPNKRAILMMFKLRGAVLILRS